MNKKNNNNKGKVNMMINYLLGTIFVQDMCDHD